MIKNSKMKKFEVKINQTKIVTLKKITKKYSNYKNDT